MPSLLDLAALVKGEVVGPGSISITGAAGIEDVREGEITFAGTTRVLETALNTPASAIIVPEDSPEIAKPVIKVANPRLAYAQILAYFTPPVICKPGIHPTAVIGKDFNGDGCEIGPLAVVGEGVSIGAGTIIHPGVVIGDRVKIGENSIIYPNVVIYKECEIGNRVQIHAGTVIGADGFGFVNAAGKQYKIPQVGNVVIEDEVEIGAVSAIDRATTGATLIRKGTKIDNLVQVGHNCQVGEDCLLCGQAAIAGSTKLGDRVTLAGRAGVVGHSKVGDGSTVGACSLVINSVPSNSFVSGTLTARPHGEDMRVQAAIGRLPDLLKEIRELQKKVADLEKKRTT
jgi:UDP-3-O-[3-hydroxymyristoyl] glucosamine N-acyltransferase